MAKECGLSFSTVGRIWRAFALKPHRNETFKLSKDPLFIEKVRDIVLHPPERAVVLSVDEKSQIQALDGRSRCCRCVRAWRGSRPTITSGTEPHPCSWP